MRKATSFRGTFCAYNAVKAVEYAVRKNVSRARLDYQPLFGKMSPQSSPLGEDQDRTRETAEIEPNQEPVPVNIANEVSYEKFIF